MKGDTQILPSKSELADARKALLEKRLRNLRQQKNEPQIPLRGNRQSAQLSSVQQRLWFNEQIGGRTPVYNIMTALRLTGLLSGPALERAMGEIVQRHEVLRSTFHVANERPIARISPSIAFRIDRVDLRDVAEAHLEAKARQVAAETASVPFDLQSGPLIRALLIRLRELEHVLVVVVHHIVADCWSLVILKQELCALYNAYSKGAPVGLPRPVVQYGDYAEWQNRRSSEVALAKHLAFWKEQLSGDLTVLELPADRPNPPKRSMRGCDHRIRLPQALIRDLQALGKREGATLFMTLLAGFQALLHRYSGQTDIIVGTPIAHRDSVEAERLIGLFVNTLPIRTNLNGDPPFQELLRRTRETALDAQAHQSLPLERIIEAIRPERHQSHSPIFQVLFTMHNTPDEELHWNELSAEDFSFDAFSSEFALNLELSPLDGDLQARFEYSTDLFDRASVIRMAGHFEVLLRGAAANPHLPLSQLPLLTESEREQLLVEWNQTEVPFSNLLAHEMVEAQAQLTPEAVAVEHGNDAISYSALNFRADRIAEWLVSEGAAPNQFVGICMDPCIDMVAAVLGVLKSGSTYVPLDPAYPEERLEFMRSDAQTAMVLTRETVNSALAADVHCAPHPVQPEQLAYLLYTSGSTGVPKGVQVPHSALANLLHFMRERPGIHKEDRWLAVTTLCFDIATVELLLPLTVGACIVLADRSVASDGKALSQKLGESNATYMQATPATWKMLIEAGWQGNSRIKIISGGEDLRPELASALLKRCGSLWNMYGPTETTIYCTIQQVIEGEPVRIGRPVANAQAYILDCHLNPAPVGVPGELHIGGAGLATGYLRRPELTAEKFIPDPFSSQPGARMYKTGDMARYLPDGTISCLGRKDHQVKMRGFRIELGEIETAIDEARGVSGCVAIVREDSPGDKRLVAYLLRGDAAASDFGQLRSVLKKRLPAYMIPSSFITLDRFPLTPNGKVDRKSLPAPSVSEEDERADFEAPETITEQLLAEIWAQVLKRSHIGRKDNFFDLGGHSLLIGQVTLRVNQAMQLDLPMRAMFEHPTLNDLALHIEAILLGELDEAEHPAEGSE